MFPESACGGRREENEKIFPLGEVRYFGWVAAGRMDGAGISLVWCLPDCEDCGVDGVTDLFPAQMLHKYTYEQLERISLKMDSGIPMDEAERQMLREEKLERFLRNDERQK